MTHREKSLTPWITARYEDRQPTVLPPSVYDAAAAQGCDMTWFVKQEPIPKTNLARVANLIRNKMPIPPRTKR